MEEYKGVKFKIIELKTFANSGNENGINDLLIRPPQPKGRGFMAEEQIFEKCAPPRTEVRGFRPSHFSNEKKQGLLELDKLIGEYIKPEKNEGNLSIRAKKGNSFFIKKAGSKMTELTERDIVFVEKVEKNYVYVDKGTPSSESIMHYEIYKNRKNANIVFHFHDDKLLDERTNPKTKNKKITEIGPFEYGTMELAIEAGKISKKQDLIKIRKHGFVVIAENKKELKAKIMELYGRL